MQKSNFDMANKYFQQLLEEQSKLSRLYDRQKGLLPHQGQELFSINVEIAACKENIKEYAEFYGRSYSFAIAKTMKDAEEN